MVFGGEETGWREGGGNGCGRGGLSRLQRGREIFPGSLLLDLLVDASAGGVARWEGASIFAVISDGGCWRRDFTGGEQGRSKSFIRSSPDHINIETGNEDV